jgi:hypothetical protein
MRIAKQTLTLLPPLIVLPGQLQEQNLVANKALLVSNGLLDMLLTLGLAEGGVSSTAVRVQVLFPTLSVTLISVWSVTQMPSGLLSTRAISVTFALVLGVGRL